MMLDERKTQVLKALVETHIRTGLPVSSRVILEASGLTVSPATVRNDLVQLERDGYAMQPHTSAGRVPTGPAYRYYVDHLSPARLRAAIATKIESFFAMAHAELDQMLQSTSELLADITRLPAMVVGPAASHELLRGAHLVQLGDRDVLTIIVTSSGRVTKEVARFAEPVPADVVASAEELLNGLIGCTFADLGRAVADTDGEPAVVATAKGAAVACTQPQHEAEVFLGGTSQLASVWEDLTKVRRILDVLEHQSTVSELLANTASGTVVRIGDELPIDDVDVALVAASYETGSGDEGRVGVLGPMRMDYRRTIRVVEEVGENLSESL